MSAYKPAEHEHDRNVAPLVQFFELVHIGDTIGQMIQVFYEKEMVCWLAILYLRQSKNASRHPSLTGLTS